MNFLKLSWMMKLDTKRQTTWQLLHEAQLYLRYSHLNLSYHAAINSSKNKDLCVCCSHCSIAMTRAHDHAYKRKHLVVAGLQFQ